jgi:predicted dehydrogenase
MGQVHARSYARLLHHYPDVPLRPELVVVVDPAPDDRLAAAAATFGFRHQLTDWRALFAEDLVDAVSVTGPNFVHRDVAVAAAQHGKHVWIEKPAGRDVSEAEQIADAVHAANVQSVVGFNYRHVPAVELTRAHVAAGDLGRVEHVTIRLLADYSAHPHGGLSWRFERAMAGTGVLGDLVSHGVDLARFLVGEIAELVSDEATFIARRPKAAAGGSHYAQVEGGELGEVENEDYVCALLRWANGARGTLEASRVAVGEQCSYGFEIHGDRGALAWDFRRMGELRTCLGQDYLDARWETRFVSRGDGELGVFQPASGITMGFDDLKVIEARQFVESIAQGKALGPTVDDAVAAARALEAMQTSARERRWVAVTPTR